MTWSVFFSLTGWLLTDLSELYFSPPTYRCLVPSGFVPWVSGFVQITNWICAEGWMESLKHEQPCVVVKGASRLSAFVAPFGKNVFFCRYFIFPYFIKQAWPFKTIQISFENTVKKYHKKTWWKKSHLIYVKPSIGSAFQRYICTLKKSYKR